MKRGYRNRDYLKTVEGLIFTVVGDVHPFDRVLAYLKYSPDMHGFWGYGTRRYDRALKFYSTIHLKDTLAYLEEMYPEYLYYSDVNHITISAVPSQSISTRYCPESRLSNLMHSENLDSLEKKVVDLATTISRESAVDLTRFGVTGSVLVDIHNPQFSDIDLIVYGRANGVKVKKAVGRMLDSGDQGLQRFDEAAIVRWLSSRAWLYPLDRKDVELMYRRHWNRGVFEGTEFSIHVGKVEAEIAEKYGDRTYTPKGMVEAEAVVADADDSLFMPGVYHVNSVRIVNGPVVSDVREIVTYEGFYSDVAAPGERIKAGGKLEEVFDKRNAEIYHRILIGSIEAGGRDYFKLEQT